MKKLKLIFFLVFVSSQTYSQKGMHRYLVLLKDKNNSPYSITRPLEFVNQRSVDRRTRQGIVFTARDLPPNPAYITSIKNTGASIWYKSRWLNAVLVLTDSTTAEAIKLLPFVKGFESGLALDLSPTGARLKESAKMQVKVDTIDYGASRIQNKMLGANILHDEGFKGEGMLIAVMDDGFNSVNIDANMTSLFTENRVVATYDFERNIPNVYDIGGHGNVVLSCMATDSPGKIVGTAPKATYALFRTEVAPNEKLIEEANYLFAAEAADSLGADIINTSLGYNTFDYSVYNHTLAQMDGKTALATRAAAWMAKVGMLPVISAGNSGGDSIWNIIASPADADSILAVGAVTKTEIRVGFSSLGPTADGRIKPDIAAVGSAAAVSSATSGTTFVGAASGTSFSSPIMAGFVACIWQANKSLTALQVIAKVKALGTQAGNPDNRLGWGIPKYIRITPLNIEEKKILLVKETTLDSKGIVFYPNPATNTINVSIPDLNKSSLVDYSIFDISGKLVNHGTILNNDIKINIISLESGFYFGIFSNFNKQYIIRFLKN